MGMVEEPRQGRELIFTLSLKGDIPEQGIWCRRNLYESAVII
jgi:hypothetical protein